jgi:hypothetical protein
MGKVLAAAVVVLAWPVVIGLRVKAQFPERADSDTK